MTGSKVCFRPNPAPQDNFTCANCNGRLIKYPDNKMGYKHRRPVADSKKCTMCEETKPLSEFYIRHDSGDGYTAHCRACQGKSKLRRDKRKKRQGFNYTTFWMPNDVHSAMQAITSGYTKETLTSFILRAVRAEIEKQVKQMRQDMQKRRRR